MTDSERLFEQFCNKIGLHFEPVQTAPRDREQRPDYRVKGRGGSTIFVEVKQFDPNPEESKEIEKMRQGGVGTLGNEPGSRVRKAIQKANPQIKALSQGKHPGLLIVCDTYALNHTHAYEVLTAMRGLDEIRILVSSDPQTKDITSPKRSGPRKKLTPIANTSISAIGVFRRRNSGEVGLDVYYNKHALVPLSPTELAGADVEHFYMRADEGGWDQVAPPIFH